MLKKFTNCRLVKGGKLIRDDLWVRKGVILDPEKIYFDEKVMADVVVDCNNAIIAPGFIDIQINGGFGIDFSRLSDDPQDGVAKVAKGILSHGVTAFCPTLVTTTKEDYSAIVPKIRRTDGSVNGAAVLGLHLEGPFISPDKKGAHPPECMLDLKGGLDDIIQTYGGDLSQVSMITVAPELSGAIGAIKQLVAKGIVVSLGHSAANLLTGEEAVRCGASCITHLFNAMSSFHHRDPGLVGLLTSDQLGGKRVHYGLIADGMHTHPAALRFAYKIDPSGLILVTDAVPALGLSVGNHTIGRMEVTVQEDKAVIAGTNTLCGSIAPMDKCVQNFYCSTEASMVEAIEMATLHPARLLGISNRKGTLEFGSDADFIILDHQLNLLQTYIGGEKAFSARDETVLGLGRMKL